MLPAMALELSDLRLPLTRSEADTALSKDYRFRVLEDMTVRRYWDLGNCQVSVDFAPQLQDKAIFIFLDYKRPTTKDAAEKDAAAILGKVPSQWQKLNPKRTERLGMAAAEGFKLSSGHFFFRELDKKGRVLRQAYCTEIPQEARWNLADDSRDSGKTAMGTRSGSGGSDFLWKDEERRRGVSVPTPLNTSSADNSLASAAAAVVADAPAKAASSRKKAKEAEMMARPEDPVDVVATAREYVGKLQPRHYAIGGGVIALLLLIRSISRAREAKRRAMVADYIMNKGRIRVERDEEE